MSRCPSELELEAHLLGGAPAAVARHVAGCPGCAQRLAAMQQEGEVFRREVFPATVDAVVAQARPRVVPGPRRWFLALAPVAAAAAAAVLFLVGGPPASYLGAKGPPLALTVYVQSGAGVHAAQDGEAVPASSAVRFQLRAPAGCRAWIVSVDAAGQVSRLFPADGDGGGELAAGAPVPGGARLDGLAGPERVYAVCSPRPLAYPEVERAVRAAAGGGERAVRAGAPLGGLPSGAAQATLLLEKRP